MGTGGSLGVTPGFYLFEPSHLVYLLIYFCSELTDARPHWQRRPCGGL